jgi:hypothetical protein
MRDKYFIKILLGNPNRSLVRDPPMRAMFGEPNGKSYKLDLC